MFRVRSDYVDEKSFYTEIRNSLHRAFRDAGSDAGIRFKDGHGLYVLQRKSWFRRQFDTEQDLARRQLRFAGAKTQLKEAIDREYESCKIFAKGHDGGSELSLGEYVMGNLGKHFNGDRLDEHALNIIDGLITEGMEKFGEQQPRFQQISKDRNKIFDHLRTVRQEEVGRSWVQRQWAKLTGDHEAKYTAKRTANWHDIVNGNHLLRKAMERDLLQSGFRGDVKGKVRQVFEGLGLVRMGLTYDSYLRAVEQLQKEGYRRTNNLLRLSAYIDLRTNLAVNAAQLHKINKALEDARQRQNVDEDTDPILKAVRQNNDLLEDIQRHRSWGELAYADCQSGFYEKLKDCYEQLDSLRESIDTNGPNTSHLKRRTAKLLDEHMAATYDLALAMRTPNQLNESQEIKPFGQPSAFEDDALHDVSTDSLKTALPVPKPLFRSASRDCYSTGEVERDYNQNCKGVLTALKSLDYHPSKENIRKIHESLDLACQINHGLTVEYTRRCALGAKVHAPMIDQLAEQRRTLQMLKLTLTKHGDPDQYLDKEECGWIDNAQYQHTNNVRYMDIIRRMTQTVPRIRPAPYVESDGAPTVSQPSRNRGLRIGESPLPGADTSKSTPSSTPNAEVDIDSYASQLKILSENRESTVNRERGSDDSDDSDAGNVDSPFANVPDQIKVGGASQKQGDKEYINYGDGYTNTPNGASRVSWGKEVSSDTRGGGSSNRSENSGSETNVTDDDTVSNVPDLPQIQSSNANSLQPTKPALQQSSIESAVSRVTDDKPDVLLGISMLDSNGMTPNYSSEEGEGGVDRQRKQGHGLTTGQLEAVQESGFHYLSDASYGVDDEVEQDTGRFSQSAGSRRVFGRSNVPTETQVSETPNTSRSSPNTPTPDSSVETPSGESAESTQSD